VRCCQRVVLLYDICSAHDVKEHITFRFASQAIGVCTRDYFCKAKCLVQQSLHKAYISVNLYRIRERNECAQQLIKYMERDEVKVL